MGNWVCPHCDRPQIIGSTNKHESIAYLRVNDPDQDLTCLEIEAIRCLNQSCKKMALNATWKMARKTPNGPSPSIMIKSWRLNPESSAKSYPDFIPKSLVNDYQEACAIVHLSPKAAATLARRCLQGMIRDFCKINKDKLASAIEQLKDDVKNGIAPRHVNEDAISAFDAVRKVGNVGAHMEKDINLIVDVEPDEAKLLIELIETLFSDWYIAREKSIENLKKVTQLADVIDARRKNGIPHKK